MVMKDSRQAEEDKKGRALIQGA